MKVLMGLGYYEAGGFTTVIDQLSKRLGELDVDVTVAARVVRKNPPTHMTLLKLSPSNFVRQATKYDAIHVHLSYPYTRALALKKIRSFVLTYHGYTPWYLVPDLWRKPVALYLKYAYRSILPKTRVITAISNFVKNQLRKLYHIDSKVIYNGVSLELFRPQKINDKPGYPVILNVTCWDKIKGVDTLTEHFKVIKAYYPEAVLISLPLREFKGGVELVKRLGLRFGKDVIAPSCMSYRELPYYYNLADFYLLTSKWESFGLPIIESFACGVPVLALDRDDARREHIENSQAGFLYRSKDELLEALNKGLKNYQFYSQRAITYAEKFDWNLIAKQYLETYTKVSE